MKQKTIKSEVQFSGISLHTGIETKIVIKPAKENTGIVFIRTDINDKDNRIPALASNVVDTSRCTKIGISKDVTVSTLEHLMAGFSGCGIDNAIVEINSPEVPILDGSSKFYIEAFLKVGVEDQKEDSEVINIKDVIRIKDEKAGSEIIAVPSDKFEIDVLVDFDKGNFKPQMATLNSMDEFNKDFASCRTFCFLHEIEYLASQNLIKGGSLENAIVYVDRDIDDNLKKVLSSHMLEEKIFVNDKGVLNNVELKYDNEAGRHKLLDVVGDLYLVGKKINAKIIAKKPGHKINTELAKKILESTDKCNYDSEAKPVKNINEITKILPHRYPFLLVDKIIELTDKRVVGVKNITMNEPYFQGHFPENPVMPGVLQVEAMAQTGGILALNSVPDPENYSTYFMKIDKVKFKQKVLPGDSVVFVLDLLMPIRRGIVHMQGTSYVKGEIVSEAELMAYIVKEKNI